MNHQKSVGLQSYDLMKLPPREATAEGDLTIPFQQSALKSTADQDPLFQHLKIRYVRAADTADQSQVNCIALHCIALYVIVAVFAKACLNRHNSNQAKAAITSTPKRFVSSPAMVWQYLTVAGSWIHIGSRLGMPYCTAWHGELHGTHWPACL